MFFAAQQVIGWRLRISRTSRLICQTRALPLAKHREQPARAEQGQSPSWERVASRNTRRSWRRARAKCVRWNRCKQVSVSENDASSSLARALSARSPSPSLVPPRERQVLSLRRKNLLAAEQIRERIPARQRVVVVGAAAVAVGAPRPPKRVPWRVRAPIVLYQLRRRLTDVCCLLNLFD